MTKEALTLALEALEIIANETYDSWTNGAEAGRIARTALLKIKNKCHAIQASDQMTCECGNVWDMNDPSPPKCASIKEALSSPNGEAQPEQEPVAWYDIEHGEAETVWNKQRPPWEGRWKPLYTTPPQHKPLTDEEIKDIRVACGNPLAIHIEFARAIEAAHGIKE